MAHALHAKIRFIVSFCIISLYLSFDIYSIRPSIARNYSSQSTRNEGEICTTKRGSNGKWVQDWAYAKRFTYELEGSYTNWHVASQKFQPTREQPYRLATSWRWEDYRCPVMEISLLGFCHVAAKLDVTRILILGDSLSIQFGISFLSLLRFPPRGRRTSFNGILKQFTVPCTNTSFENETKQLISFNVDLLIYRRSPIGDFEYLNHESYSNGTLANDQRTFVENNPNRTVIIANTGAWMKGMGNYTFAFHSILNWIDSFPDANSKILAFYRPTIPGHFKCKPNAPNITTPAEFNWTEPVQQSPYDDYSDYLLDTQMILSSDDRIEKYNWLDFESYNRYSHQFIENRTEDSLKIYWLNIFNSSVLRQDGHVGFGDCLHYYHPGPTDWWVHFFYSMLWDVAKS